MNNVATPPSVPTNLSVTGTTTSTVSLSWNPSTAGTYAIAGYKIYRGGTQVGTSAGTNYTDTGLTASTTYTYTVAAYDTNGNTSAQSGSVNATTQKAGSYPVILSIFSPLVAPASGCPNGTTGVPTIARFVSTFCRTLMA